MKRYRIKIRKPWIAYVGSTIQQNYSEELEHGYLLWSVKDGNDYDVEFRALKNQHPFVTIDWKNSVDDVVEKAKEYPKQSRLRIRSDINISQKDVRTLTDLLKSQTDALEITFKIEDEAKYDIINSGNVKVFKDDLRNFEVHAKLLRDYYKELKISQHDWEKLDSLLKKYLQLATLEDESPRNIKWTIKRLEFDNLFTFGEKNVINFENKTGITGIFGQNRIGKSSIVGALIYSLFNSTDRGPIKNLHVVNARKNYGLTKVYLEIDGIDYLIERQTTKHENKKGETLASTNLNFFRINNDLTLTDLNGEQRTDTEKNIRKLIGSPEDFMITSLSAQFDLIKFTNEGATSRKQILSRFVGLDLFDSMFDHVRDDISLIKPMTKNLLDKNWESLIEENSKKLIVLEEESDKLQKLKLEKESELHKLQSEYTKNSGNRLITLHDIKAQENVIVKIESAIASYKLEIEKKNNSISDSRSKIEKIENLRSQFDIEYLRNRFDNQKLIETNLLKIKHELQIEESTYTAQKKSVLKLLEVPCEDQFPSCKFIKDSHNDKLVIESQKQKVESILKNVDEISKNFLDMKDEKLDEKIKKFEQSNELYNRLKLEIVSTEKDISSLESKLSVYAAELIESQNKLCVMKDDFKKSDNEGKVFLKKSIETAQFEIKSFDEKRIDLAKEQGKINTELSSCKLEKEKANELLEKMRLYDLISSAFSKKGIPNLILNSQLPAINSEIAKVLHGVVDFTIELHSDLETNSMEIYLNYGDSKRIIELGSGMEKTITSIAIRAALLNITSLPKTDMFIIDEGFGTLDASQVEACSRFLVSLKKIFRNILVITHVDAIKDSVDNIIEISRNEKDSFVKYV